MPGFRLHDVDGYERHAADDVRTQDVVGGSRVTATMSKKNALAMGLWTAPAIVTYGQYIIVELWGLHGTPDPTNNCGQQVREIGFLYDDGPLTDQQLVFTIPPVAYDQANGRPPFLWYQGSAGGGVDAMIDGDPDTGAIFARSTPIGIGNPLIDSVCRFMLQADQPRSPIHTIQLRLGDVTRGRMPKRVSAWVTPRNPAERYLTQNGLQMQPIETPCFEMYPTPADTDLITVRFD